MQSNLHQSNDIFFYKFLTEVKIRILQAFFYIYTCIMLYLIIKELELESNAIHTLKSLWCILRIQILYMPVRLFVCREEIFFNGGRIFRYLNI